ncbi:MAG: helical backbone metal receptor [Steroidobacteraceae bacterium]
MADRFLCLLLLMGQAVAAAASGGRIVTDDLGQRLDRPDRPLRIVSLAPGATEMLFAAGAGVNIVGTAEYSDTPAAARNIARIGDSQALDVERIIALTPDVVVAWPQGNPAGEIDKLRRLALPIYQQQAARLAELPDSLLRLGALADSAKPARRRAAVLRREIAALRARYAHAERMKVFIQIWDQPLYTVGGRHFMSDALSLCGADNIFSDLAQSAPLVSVEAVIARNPQIIVAAAPQGSAEGWLSSWRRFPDLDAVAHARLVGFEDQRFGKLAPSAVNATAALCQRLSALVAPPLSP